MPVKPHIDIAAAGVAATIGEPARARMLYRLLDGHARTSTELAVIGEVSPSTASVHLARITRERLVTVLSQGKHRYYSLANSKVARALESLDVVAGGTGGSFVPKTPMPLRAARTCYDHMAGYWAVGLRERCEDLGWLRIDRNDAYDLTSAGANSIASIGVDVEATRALRRRFAYACVDWSERRPHIGGALGHALLELALRRRWFVRDLDSRALSMTNAGRRQLQSHFGLQTSAGTVPA